ncbi:hypothetical protein DUNSADRAFT_17770 [Dunaliella salina]|uniref:Pseudouridine synthase I TruA alpha/beta domain-containing protein n=1 Tax=Dunaliella salina TaxID=3046 RepID=A0ABQ7G165_DUNSA|nr:hypothetical protein DUNSADRAFT_17770 [Dunaliella salina]|eukprot:KAF5828336.1 hypothetical protein DUNSADRAFT_17770 [Dunaliella salina]
MLHRIRGFHCSVAKTTLPRSCLTSMRMPPRAEKLPVRPPSKMHASSEPSVPPHGIMGATAAQAEQVQQQPAEQVQQQTLYQDREQGALRQSGWDQHQPSRLPRMPGSKRSVAMHVAYVGTAFRGLQINRLSAPESTVEGALEVALLRAGLIAPSNYGDLYRLKWTRSSRTDKGVHSLATVIGLRIVLQDVEGLYTADPEGLGIADRINQHLPPSVKVLCVQRVNKKFTARRACKERTYTYYLPAALLDLKCDQSQEDSEKISLFRSALSAFVGRHPFHNYTPKSKRVLYPHLKPDAAEWRARKDAARTARGPVDTLAKAAAVMAGVDPRHGAQQQPGQQHGHGSGAGIISTNGGPLRSERQQSEQHSEQQHGDGAANNGSHGAAVVQGQHASAQSHSMQDHSVQQGGDFSMPQDGGSPRAAEFLGAQGHNTQSHSAQGRSEEQANAQGHSAQDHSVQGHSTQQDGRLQMDTDGDRSLTDGHQLHAQHVWGRGRRRDGAQSSDDDVDEGESDEEEAEMDSDLEGGSLKEGSDQLPQRFNCTCEFQGYVAPENRLPIRVYRVIYSFTAEDPTQLVPGGVPCLKLVVHGQSFLLNHIRHMIGAAVAVTRGLMPLDLLRASLHAPARTSVPKAPPHTLILTASKFSEFSPRAGSEIAVEKYTGRQLRIREGAARAQQEFQEQVLGPALNDLLLHPNWEIFNIILPRYHWNPEAVASVLEQDAAWCARRAEFKAAQQRLKEENENREAKKQEEEKQQQDGGMAKNA